VRLRKKASRSRNTPENPMISVNVIKPYCTVNVKYTEFFRKFVAGFWMLDAGCWILDAGYWILDAGCWMLDAGCWMLDTGYWILDAGYWNRKSQIGKFNRKSKI